MAPFPFVLCRHFFFVMLHNSKQNRFVWFFCVFETKFKDRDLSVVLLSRPVPTHTSYSLSFLLSFLVSSRNVGHIIWHCFMYNLKYYVKRRPLIFILLMIKRANKANLILTEEKNNKTMSVVEKKEADIHTEKKKKEIQTNKITLYTFFLSSFKILRLLVVFVLYQFFKSLKRVYSSWYISAVTR